MRGPTPLATRPLAAMPLAVMLLAALIAACGGGGDSADDDVRSGAAETTQAQTQAPPQADAPDPQPPAQDPSAVYLQALDGIVGDAAAVIDPATAAIAAVAGLGNLAAALRTVGEEFPAIDSAWSKTLDAVEALTPAAEFAQDQTVFVEAARDLLELQRDLAEAAADRDIARAFSVAGDLANDARRLTADLSPEFLTHVLPLLGSAAALIGDGPAPTSPEPNTAAPSGSGGLDMLVDSYPPELVFKGATLVLSFEEDAEGGGTRLVAIWSMRAPVTEILNFYTVAFAALDLPGDATRFEAADFATLSQGEGDSGGAVIVEPSADPGGPHRVTVTLGLLDG